jgi:hypothetical protein
MRGVNESSPDVRFVRGREEGAAPARPVCSRTAETGGKLPPGSSGRTAQRVAAGVLVIVGLLGGACAAGAQGLPVSTLAGLKAFVGSADGTGSAARFNYPAGVAVDGAGTVYVADSSNHTVRKVTPGGVVTTLAGLAGFPGSANGTGSAARFFFPNGVAVDGAGTVYVADSGNDTIRKVTAAGVVTTLAGLAGFPGSANGTGSAARFDRPSGVAVDGVGTVYVADQGNHTIRKVTAVGVVTTLAGLAGVPGSANGTGSAARFTNPAGVAVDGVGTVYVADTNNHTIRRVTAAGAVTTVAGSPGTPGSADGIWGGGQFYHPHGVAVAGLGIVYVADATNRTIRKVTPSAVSTPAGLAGIWGSADGTGSAARFHTPWGVAVDAAGLVYVADTWNHAIRRARWIVPRSEYDGDGRSDVAVYRPSTGWWYIIRSNIGTGWGRSWGVSGDIPVPADYDGDGKTDVAVYRPSTGVWYIVRSSTAAAVSVAWGLPGDVPVPADYDGDGRADPAVFRPSTGTWYQLRSATGTGVAVSWGVSGDVPVPADYDGDGRADPTVFRPTTGTWYQLRSTTNSGHGVTWGMSGDVPVPADYDGDGKTDPAVFRPSTGTWYQLRSTTGTGYGLVWGVSTDVPLAADYDGDGRADPTVYRPSTGVWYLFRSTTNSGVAVQWGAPGDIPVAQ